VYVDGSNTGLEDGSRDCPWNTIAEGLRAAQSGDTILVAEGTYSENLTVDKDVVLAGGYAAYTSPAWTRNITVYVTIVDGRDLGSVITVTNHAMTVISGFTITHGRAPLGGGLQIDGSSVVLQDDIIIGNHATGPSPDGNGGGLYVTRASVTLSNTRVLSNTAFQWGGGIYLIASSADVHNTTVVDNMAAWEGGGGICVEKSSAHITDSQVMSNTANCCGGGIGAADSSLVLDGNRISHNRVDPTSYLGGGIYANHSSATINANVILGNRALAGGGIAAGDMGYVVTNNLVAQNFGGGILVRAGQIVNNTIRDNFSNDYGEYGDGLLVSPLASPSFVTITNNIIVSNVYGIGSIGAGITTSLFYNDVWGNSTADYAGLAPGTNDISVDPLLVPLMDDGYHLLPGSPCIDAGTNENAPGVDLDGDPRPSDGDADGVAVVDIGADEVKATVTPPKLQILLPFVVRYRCTFLPYIARGR
jgi:hypothetical protein